MIKRIFLVGFLVLLLALAGCSDDPPPSPIEQATRLPVSFLSVSSTNAQVTANDGAIALAVTSYERVAVSYRIAQGIPHSLCTVSLTIDATALDRADGQAPAISLEADLAHDANSKVVSTVGHSTENGHYTVRRLLPLDENGEAEFSVVLGSESQPVRGEAQLSAPSCIPVEQDLTYAVYSNAEQTVRFIFLAEDIQVYRLDTAVINDMMRRMADLDASLAELTGHAKLSGACTDYVFTESIPYTALAGRPIYINREELSHLIPAMIRECAKPEQPLAQSDCTALFAHELSHTYDVAALPNIQAQYCFDKELFATLKSIYALEANGYTLSDTFLSRSPALSSGMYNYEVLLSRLLDGIRQAENGWATVGQALQALYAPGTVAQTPLESYLAFTDALTSTDDGDILQVFSADELAFLKEYFRVKSQ